MQNNIPTVYNSEMRYCIVKSTNLSTILPFCTIKYKEIKHVNFKNIVLSWQHLTPHREPAFSVGQLRILLLSDKCI
jgi:hypothetical protein